MSRLRVIATMWHGTRTVPVSAWRGAPPRGAAPPTQADLDAIAERLLPENGGVRPVVRVLETSTLPGRSLGAAGSTPR